MSGWTEFGGHWMAIPYQRGDRFRSGRPQHAERRRWEDHAQREAQETFCGQALNVPGTEIELDNGVRYLIGHMTPEGCFEGRKEELDEYAVVARYRVWKPSED